MLSRLMLVTDRAAMKPDFSLAMSAALEGGARLIQLREKDLSKNTLCLLAQGTLHLCRNFGATLVINSHDDIAHELYVAKGGVSDFQVGVHWPQHLIPESVRSKNIVLSGASVHSVESAQRAEKAGVDYLIFGSVFPTTSHPGEEPAGLESLRAVVDATDLPVYAIGGIDNEYSIKCCLEAGAYGVAVRSAVWDAQDICKKVLEMLRCVGE